MNPTKRRIVIIGGVAAGTKTACRIRRLDPEAEVILVDRTENISYGACPLPYYIKGSYDDIQEVRKTPSGALRDEDFFAGAKGFTVMSRTEAVAIDREQQKVSLKKLDSGQQVELDYDKLVFATGNTPIIPPLPGMDLNGVLPLKTMQQAEEIKQRALNGKHAVVVGGGLIGLEVAEALVHRGVKVTLLEMMPQVLNNILEPDMAALVHKELQQNGVDLRLEEALEAVEGENGEVTKVKTAQGEYPADMVLVSIGVKPNVQLAKDCGVEMGPTGAIAVDPFQRTSDPNIYAAGDCAESTHILSHKKSYVPLGSTANRQGRVVANHICGRVDSFPGIMGSLICKVFNLNVGRSGLNTKEATDVNMDPVTVIAPSPDKPHTYPDSKPLVIKLTADRHSRKLLGVQVVGSGDASKRVDVMVTALNFGATVDQVAHLDLSYAPPFSGPMDSLHMAANALRNKLDGLAASFSPLEVKERLDAGVELRFIDVRSPDEYAEVHIPGSENIPLPQLRKQAEQMPKETLIIPFCKVSMRGFEAVRILQAAGCRNVAYMEGGVAAWPFKLES